MRKYSPTAIINQPKNFLIITLQFPLFGRLDINPANVPAIIKRVPNPIENTKSRLTP